MNRVKELAKFFAGFAANKVLTLAVLGASDALPIKIFGFTLTAEYDFGILAIWAVALAGFIYYAWIKK